MAKKILFSPVGGTDPIRFRRDGSVLHICRVYKPDVVCLYMSREMLEHHREDNRYVEMIQRLGEKLEHTFEVRVIEREELVDVQQYDVFYKEFRSIIMQLEKELEPADELLVNTSSGTPAMKSALLVLATLAEYRFTPIQVSTPLKKQNNEEEPAFDVKTAWETNEDNAEEFEVRSEEIKSMNLVRLLKIDMIKKHLAAYDYTAARAIAEEIRDGISEEAYTLIEIACERLKLNSKKIDELMKKVNYELYPVKPRRLREIFEYLLVLDIKIKKEEYADYVRAITPVILDLLEMILLNECGVDV